MIWFEVAGEEREWRLKIGVEQVIRRAGDRSRSGEAVVDPAGGVVFGISCSAAPLISCSD
jgi:hypothetical protein